MKSVKQHILLVEDSPTQAAKLRYLLEGNGYSISVAGDAGEAQDILQQHTPALVLSDVLMPGLSGFDLCRRIKEDPMLQDTAVILITALKTPEDVINGLTCGADGFLTKPYSESFLLDMVSTVLDTQKMHTLKSSDKGVEIFYGGKKYTITAERHRILGLLLSTFENVIQKNQELEEANRESKAIQRKLQISEERLRKQTSDLVRANAELESFSYSVSHDLRQPLRIIKSFSQILKADLQKGLEAKAHNHLERIINSTAKMDNIIRDLLNLSRVSRLKIAKENTDLSSLAANIVEELRTQEPERNINVAIQPDMHHEVDPTLLRQVLTNLIGNAWKYSSNSPHAQVTFQRTQERDRLVYSVSDNGAGFDSRYVKKLFKPFSRLHRESEFPGTGVGLAIVKRIIDRHDGEVGAEGAPGEGATFSFSLPRET